VHLVRAKNQASSPDRELMKSSIQIFASLLVSFTTFSQFAIATYVPTDRQVKHETCKPIDTITKILKKQNPKASLTIKKILANQYYTNAPQGFLLDVTTMNSQISNTSELSYRKQIIRQCHGVVAVRFSEYGSDWGYVYGLVNSRVRRFECPQGKSPGNRPFRWGNECLA
jgi:hypothetical protein